VYKIKHRKIKLLFFHDNLELGGGERVIINILHNLDKNKFDFSLVLSEKKGVFLNDAKGIDIIDMKIKKIKSKKIIWRFCRYIKRVYKVYRIIKFKKPDIVITISTTLTPIVAFTKLFARREKVIIGVHVNIVKALKNRFLQRILIKLSYLIADKIIPVSNSIAEDINKNFNVPKDKIKVIYNVVNIDEIDRLKNEEIDDEWFKNIKNNLKIISVGRISHEKGYKNLLNAFKIVRENGIDVYLIILGEGEEKTNLRNLALRLGIQEYVVFAGFKRNPYKYMKNSDVFVLSSVSEAFPLVLIEAMICGVPIISTKCHRAELITDGVNGILVPVNNEKAMADAIINLLRDKGKAKKLSGEGIKRVKDFDIKKMIEEYEKTFVECYYKGKNINHINP